MGIFLIAFLPVFHLFLARRLSSLAFFQARTLWFQFLIDFPKCVVLTAAFFTIRLSLRLFDSSYSLALGTGTDGSGQEKSKGECHSESDGGT